MSEEKPDPLNPDSKQQLFEKLSMDQKDLEALNFIRKHVKIIINQEQNGTKKSDNTDF